VTRTGVSGRVIDLVCVSAPHGIPVRDGHPAARLRAALSLTRAAIIWAAFNVLQLATGVYALRLDREPLRPLWALPLQQFVYLRTQ
jgi:hypothetical protein